MRRAFVFGGRIRFGEDEQGTGEHIYYTCNKRELPRFRRLMKNMAYRNLQIYEDGSAICDTTSVAGVISIQ